MAEEEIKDVEVEIEGKQEPEPEVIDPNEDRARSEGWVDVDEWEEQGKPKSEWVDASTFNMRGELFKTIHTQNKKITDLQAALNDLSEFQGKIAETERTKVIAELKKAKAAALENEEYDKVVDIDEELLDITTTKAKEPTSSEDTSADEAAFNARLVTWKQDNPWYDKDEDLRVYADGLGTSLAQQGMNWEEIFDRVSTKIKAVFPQKFENPNRDKQTVSTSTRTTKNKQSAEKYTFSDLSDEQKAIAKRFERTGVMDVDAYIAQLGELGEIGN